MLFISQTGAITPGRSAIKIPPTIWITDITFSTSSFLAKICTAARIARTILAAMARALVLWHFASISPISPQTCANVNKPTITKTKNKSNSKDKESNISETKSINNNKENSSIGIQSGDNEGKQEIDIIIPSLPDDEIIEPDEPLPEEGKMPNPSFCKNYVSNLLNSSKVEIDPNILTGVGIGLNKVLMSVQEDLEDDKIEIGKEPLNIEDIKQFKLNSSSIMPNPNFETSIRMQKIKKLNQSKRNLEKQINQLSNKINLM